MAKFLTTSEVSAHIERIIREAKEAISILSPYVKLRRNLFERLRDASRKGIKITLIYGKSELDNEQESWLRELSDLDLRFSDNLHAKCYFNEDLMVITSMNMYDFSEITNREMGVLITRDQDEEVFKAAREEFRSIRSNAKPAEMVKRVKAQESIPHPARQRTAKSNYGFCIRCHERINYNPEAPLCDNCYGTWAQYQDPFYEENLCHKCGKPANTSKAKPLCHSCFLKS